MIKIENAVISSIEAAIRGMRNPMNSWDKSDSVFYDCVTESYHSIIDSDVNCDARTKQRIKNDILNQAHGMTEYYAIGPIDMNLMTLLASNGSVHAKYRRFITVSMDITAPLYWWKEFDTYKVGTVADSCSTMHKIADKPFDVADFSVGNLIAYTGRDSEDDTCTVDVCEKFGYYDDEYNGPLYPYEILSLVIDMLNVARDRYNETKDKRYWWQMIQLLPSSYNQKRTVLLNYEVLSNIYSYRKDHKLDEWRDFCKWIETLPLAEGVIFQKDDKEEDE